MSTTGDLTRRGVKTLDMEDVQIAHLAGVFDVAGSLTVNVGKNDRYRIGYEYQPFIRLYRPYDPEDPLLGKLTAYCDDLAVRYNILEKGKNGEPDNHEFIVKDPDSMERFLEPMMPYFVVRYEAASLLTEVVLPAVKNDEHTTKEGFLRLMPAADQLRAGTKRDVKYDTAFFENEWSMDAEELLPE